MTPQFPAKFSAESIQGTQFHFVGIGGCGMSGLARLIDRIGGIVGGTDSTETSITEDLIKDGIPVSYVQDGSMIPEKAEIIVYSAAIRLASIFDQA